MTQLKGRSRSVRPPVGASDALCLTSPMERAMPATRLLRIRNRVYAALVSMPPIAIGRTIVNHTLLASAIQLSVVGTAPGANTVGAMK